MTYSNFQSAHLPFRLLTAAWLIGCLPACSSGDDDGGGSAGTAGSLPTAGSGGSTSAGGSTATAGSTSVAGAPAGGSGGSATGGSGGLKSTAGAGGMSMAGASTGGSSTGGASTGGTGGKNIDPECMGIKTGKTCPIPAKMCPSMACGLADAGRRDCTCAGTDPATALWSCTKCDFTGTPYATAPPGLVACVAQADGAPCALTDPVCFPTTTNEACACMQDVGKTIWDCDSKSWP